MNDAAQTADKIILCLGTYSGIILGYEIYHVDTTVTMKLIFSCEAHLGSVTSLCISGAYLFTGGSDELIKIYDLNKLNERGSLTAPGSSASAIQCVHEKNAPYLLVFGCDDGSVHAWQGGSKQWTHQMTGSASTSAVTSVAIHPSRRVVLLCTSDPAPELQLWDLTDPYPVSKQKLNSNPLSVCWAAGTQTIGILLIDKAIIRKAEESKLEHSINIRDTVSDPTIKYTAMTFYTEKFLLLTSSKGHIWGYNVKSTIKQEFSTQLDSQHRIRSIQCFPGVNALRFITIEAEGQIKFWTWNNHSLEQQYDFDTSARITCADVSLHNPH